MVARASKAGASGQRSIVLKDEISSYTIQLGKARYRFHLGVILDVKGSVDAIQSRKKCPPKRSGRS